MSPVTRAFASPQIAAGAIRALEAGGIDPRSISILTRASRDAESLEHITGASDDLEDASIHRGRLSRLVDWLGKVESATVPSFGAVLGTGDLWQDIRIAGSGHGSVTGALVGCGVPVDEAARLEDAVDAGQTLVVIHGHYDPATVNRVLDSA